MARVIDRLALDVTPEEAEFGFSVTEYSGGFRAVSREVRPGLRAVKVRGEGDAVEYAICNEQFVQLYPSARSVDELRTRFPAVRY